MDLEAYMSRYDGETRLQRLLHIGNSANDASTVTQAYEMAEAQMKLDGNVIRYKEVFGDGACGVRCAILSSRVVSYLSCRSCRGAIRFFASYG